ncbi:MAG: M20 family metallopeptidase [Elusimicrobia bacterium]|nr:M20 family metallopeptidase [Elusimicrobiota bacterium]
MRKRLLKRVDELAPEIVAVSRFVHEHPEMGYREFQAADFLAGKLVAQGFTVERPMKKMRTALRAVFKGKRPKPAVGFISEYDALPDIGHGCGHNLIAASGFGAAAALAPFAKELGGSVWLFGTPAEESGNGKVLMVEAGLFDPVDAVMMMHPESMYLVNTSALALDALEFRFFGRASHAASTPYEGVNALDAVIQLFNAVNALRQQLRPDVRVHGIITQGGSFPNVIPDFTEARFYVRAEKRKGLDAVTKKVKGCARGAAQAAGCRLKISEFERPLDDIRNNPVLGRILEGSLRSLGVKQIVERDEVPGSSDFGNVSQRRPAQYIYCATAPKGKDLHTREFARLSAAPLAHLNLILSVKALALAGLELLLDPALVRQAWRAMR